MKVLRQGVALGVLVIGVGSVGLLGAGAASAHVTVAAPGVVAGASDAVITFRVPDESDTASTVGLKVQLPLDTPIAGVLVSPQQGWTAKITQSKLATPITTDDGTITEVVSEIDWTADAGAGIKPGYFGQFSIIAGKLPDDAAKLTFKAIQTYSDMSVVSWIEEAAPGSTAEPEHPAPELALAAATVSDAPASSAPTVSASAPVSQSSATQPSASSSARATTGIVLGVIAIVLAAGALAVTVMRRRSAV